jgi:hypothetical protein
MLERVVHVMFVGSCLLLAAILLRKDLFLVPGWKPDKFAPASSQKRNESRIVSQECHDSYKINLEQSSSQWDPILVNFLVNQKSVNVALASTDHLYLQLKALEFCTENAAVLNLQSLEQLEKDCAFPLVSVLYSKVQSGEYLRPVARKETVVENSSTSETTHEMARDDDSNDLTNNMVSTESLPKSVLPEDNAAVTGVSETTYIESSASEQPQEITHNALEPSTSEETEPADSKLSEIEANEMTVVPIAVEEGSNLNAEIVSETVDDADTARPEETSDVEDGLKLRVEEVEILQVDAAEPFVEVDESGEQHST